MGFSYLAQDSLQAYINNSENRMSSNAVPMKLDVMT